MIACAPLATSSRSPDMSRMPTVAAAELPSTRRTCTLPVTRTSIATGSSAAAWSSAGEPVVTIAAASAADHGSARMAIAAATLQRPTVSTIRICRPLLFDLSPLDEVPVDGRRARDVAAAALHVHAARTVGRIDLQCRGEVLQCQLEVPASIGREAVVVQAKQLAAVSEVLVREADQLEHRNRLVLAVDCEQLELAGDDAGPGGVARRPRDHRVDAVRLARGLEARGQIDGVAERGVIEFLFAADIAYHGPAAVDADAHAEMRPPAALPFLVHAGEAALHAHRGAARAQRVIGLVERCAVER